MAAGNYGGNSTPTTPIGGAELVAGKLTTYKNYKCTTIVSSATTGTFTYKGALYTLGAAGQTINLVVNPSHLNAASGVYFLCYECGCDGAMTGNTDASVSQSYNSEFYSGKTAIKQVTFLGMGANQS